MAGVIERAEQLTALARSRAPDDRERLMLGIADLCSVEGAMEAPQVQGLLGDVFMTLVVEAEQDIRARLAERLADAPWVPKALVNVLALDEIDIARPIIARSPVLDDADLLRLLVGATLEHRIEIARRPHLSEAVTQAAVARGEPAVLSAIVRNSSAHLSGRTMEQLVLASRRIADLRSPLARHPRLNAELAALLYGWVGRTLRDVIVKRFRVDEAELDAAVADAVRKAQAGAPVTTEAATPGGDAETDRMEQRLISKLNESGKLRPGYLIRTLKEGKLGLFEAAFASLLDVTVAQVRAAIKSDRPELLAYACTAVGVDRLVYPAMLTDLRKLTGGWPRTGADSARKVASAFEITDPADARSAFRNALAG